MLRSTDPPELQIDLVRPRIPDAAMAHAWVVIGQTGTDNIAHRRLALYRLLIAFIGVCYAGLAPSTFSADEAPPNAYRNCVWIKFDGEIHPPRTKYLKRQLDVAKERGADLVILEIDSPGGWIDDSLELAHLLRKTTWARTVAYVPREALSGAAIISLGCDEIVLHPDAHFGDAGPISFDVSLWSYRHADEKIRSHLARNVRDLAEAKGRPPSIAEAMVDKDLEVHSVRDRDSGKTDYLSEHELNAPEHRDRWEKQGVVLEARKGRFLEVNGQRAVELRLANAVVNDRQSLLRRFDVEQPTITLQWTSADATDEKLFHVAMFLNIPLIAGVLIVVGIIGLCVEFASPGTAVGGIIGATCFALFFWSHFMQGTSGWLEVILFLLGVSLLAVELFVIPGFGICGFTGLAMIMASLILAGQEFVIPRSGEEWSRFSHWLLVLSVASVILAVVGTLASRHFKSLPLFRRLILESPTSSASASGVAADSADSEMKSPIVTGAVGIAQTMLRPSGKARFGDELVDVVADGAFIERGSTVTIAQVVGHRIIVKGTSS